ncbi:hypothetical protein NQ318_008828 [Aromia moschata]|uniref:Uncharacterized protein n=1 Tax=Aromia moschata TaxID=1265417 RepID=A0AAV8ZCF9_9CUCU|nr:hypothetical protein NQ318_008828 [Aromia moschata]
MFTNFKEVIISFGRSVDSLPSEKSESRYSDEDKEMEPTKIDYCYITRSAWLYTLFVLTRAMYCYPDGQNYC